MLTCKDIATLATDHLEGRLSFGQRLRIRLHLAMCRHCRTYVEQIAQTIDTLRRMPMDPVPARTREALLTCFRDWASSLSAAHRPGRVDDDMS